MSLSHHIPGIFQQRSLVGIAHVLWKDVLKPGDFAIDATCGRGGDSLKMASMCLSQTSGWLYCIDIQEQAIQQTRTRLESNGYLDRVTYIRGSHDIFPACIDSNSVGCVAYNLGYLPGNSDKTLVTHPETTIASVTGATKLLRAGGLLTIAAYPGHSGGDEEVRAVEEVLGGLPSTSWRVFKHIPFLREKPPILYSAYKLVHEDVDLRLDKSEII